MTIDSFQYIWKQGIAKSAKDVFDGIHPDLQVKYSVSIDVSDAMCKMLYDFDICRYVVLDREV